ncbi:MAG: hypothetical protein H7A39_05075 [Chlamydiales bacterium]|nr:hypothetical protein [Chlamydiales bacterium]
MTMEWKKFTLVCILSFTCLGAFADEAESSNEEPVQEQVYVPKIYEENLDQYIQNNNVHMSRYIRWNSTEIMLLSDDSVWMVNPLEVRVAGWWDRLRGREITQPEDRFLAKPIEWKEDSDLKVYRYNWKDSGLAKIYEFDATRLIYCTHILQNVATGQMVFARQLKNCHVVQLFNSWVQDVRSKGFVEGYEKGYNDAKKI